MEDLIFYLKMGWHHVLDPQAYDHILFLAALAIPFSFRQWKSVIVLATLFTLAHCLSLTLSAYDLIRIEASWVEFLIPITIASTAIFNFFVLGSGTSSSHYLFTVIFGLIHGFGFSNYFNMMLAEESEKAVPLLGFAAGIELSQVCIILAILGIGFVLVDKLNLPKKWFIWGASVLVLVITLPLLIKTWPL